jgi:hypothetical protein
MRKNWALERCLLTQFHCQNISTMLFTILAFGEYLELGRDTSRSENITETATHKTKEASRFKFYNSMTIYTYSMLLEPGQETMVLQKD